MGEKQGSKKERVWLALLMLSPYFQFPFLDSDELSVFDEGVGQFGEFLACQFGEPAKSVKVANFFGGVSKWRQSQDKVANFGVVSKGSTTKEIMVFLLFFGLVGWG